MSILSIYDISADSEILNLNRNKFLDEQSGRSMIEMLGVLAIIGVLSVGGIAGYSKAMMQYKINKTTDQITQIIGNIRTLYGSQKNYGSAQCDNTGSGAFCTVIKKAHLVPDEMWNTAGTKIENAFGGEVYFLPADKKSSDSVPSKYNAYGMIFTGLPEDACMALATYDWGSGSSSGLLAVGINAASPHALIANAAKSSNGSAIAKPNDATVSIPMPVNVAASACVTGDSNSFTITFF
jgi:Tfp pilus assembly protein PilE